MQTNIVKQPEPLLKKKDNSKVANFFKTLIKQRWLVFMVLPGFALLLVFKYFPMYGVLVAFKDYNIRDGIIGSPWVGFKHMEAFFASPLSWRIIRNSVLLAVYSLIFTFPAPIIFALLLNELRNRYFKRTVQTITYFPHFLSTVIVVGFVFDISSMNGLINKFVALFGMEPKIWLNFASAFRPLFIGSGIWQELGYGSIIFLAAITGIDPTQYEAAEIDGANRWQKLRFITWPAIIPATTVMLILKMGSILTTDFQKVLLMYNPKVYETADVIETYVYRMGVQGGQFEYGAAVGLMLSIVSFVLIIFSNYAAKKVSGNSVW
ncbi:ABC transporter permease [Paenibacillus yanchengensis]|uniref:ABC transporter permease n=1 Tax=Paenibacillus yanchengensis TaxID=2035833 RepID=A0ABW4YGT1_9BACL